MMSFSKDSLNTMVSNATFYLNSTLSGVDSTKLWVGGSIATVAGVASIYTLYRCLCAEPAPTNVSQVSYPSTYTQHGQPPVDSSLGLPQSPAATLPIHTAVNGFAQPTSQDMSNTQASGSMSTATRTIEPTLKVYAYTDEKTGDLVGLPVASSVLPTTRNTLSRFRKNQRQYTVDELHRALYNSVRKVNEIRRKAGIFAKSVSCRDVKDHPQTAALLSEHFEKDTRLTPGTVEVECSISGKAAQTAWHEHLRTIKRG